ncbi:MAG: hypothetical protein V4550_19765 [Gemmatimonadota bacterium]
MISPAGTRKPKRVVVAPWRQERLRFTDFASTKTRTGEVTCTVHLALGERSIAGTASGQGSPSGDTRLGAEATLRALETFTGNTFAFELIGVKVVRAFDTNVVITSIIQRSAEGTERLLGCYLAGGDPVRGAAIAAMNATNRTLTSYILGRPEVRSQRRSSRILGKERIGTDATETAELKLTPLP